MQIRKQAMPMAISTAPNAAITNQICSEGSVKWLTRRVTPIRPSTYSGVKANQYPASQNQKDIFPQKSLSLKPDAFGNQNVMPPNRPQPTPATDKQGQRTSRS